MADPEILASQSVDNTQPAAARPATPPQHVEPKPPKKLDPTVVVAIIGQSMTIREGCIPH